MNQRRRVGMSSTTGMWLMVSEATDGGRNEGREGKGNGDAGLICLPAMMVVTWLLICRTI